ncbi:uncharacterized protein LOC128953183 [Oppia nitens]|uniref:uncharacterized protein LOC128953183 n=1 Tax=Oppia nitens TaxID=1686743 RepID=UPI0023DA00A4|nr:uncharacterized protein LOC128953183 [Oppia nitens]
MNLLYNFLVLTVVVGVGLIYCSSESDSSDSGSHHKKHHKNRKHHNHKNGRQPAPPAPVVYRLPVKFDLVGLLMNNGMSTWADQYRRQLSDLDTNLDEFFNGMATVAEDDLDFVMRYDLDQLLVDLSRGLKLFRKNIDQNADNNGIDRNFSGRIATGAQLFDELSLYLVQLFASKDMDRRHRRQHSIYRYNLLSKPLIELSGELGKLMTRDIEPNFQRVLYGFYRSIGQAYNAAIGEQVKRLSGSGGGRDQLPEKYRYLIAFNKRWDQSFGQIKQLFKKKY